MYKYKGHAGVIRPVKGREEWVRSHPLVGLNTFKLCGRSSPINRINRIIISSGGSASWSFLRLYLYYLLLRLLWSPSKAVLVYFPWPHSVPLSTYRSWNLEIGNFFPSLLLNVLDCVFGWITDEMAAGNSLFLTAIIVIVKAKCAI